MKPYEAPKDWVIPSWFYTGKIDIPAWLLQWAQRPCDCLVQGPEPELFLLYILIKRYYPLTCIEKHPVDVLYAYKDFDEVRQFRMAENRGQNFPVDPDVVFLTDIHADITTSIHRSMAITFPRYIETRRCKRKLTVLSGPITRLDLAEKLKVSVPLHLEVVT